MTKKLLTLVFLSIGMTVLAQKYEFDIQNTSLKEYIEKEKALGGERIPNTSNYISFGGEAQPIKFQRIEKIIPDLITYLYFKEKDSTMMEVMYEWDVRNFNEEDAPQSKKFQKKLIQKYKKLEQQITKLYGEPNSRGDLSDLDQVNQKRGLERNCKWNIDDTTEIVLYIVVSNYYEKRGIITINPTHKIRLYIKNKRK